MVISVILILHSTGPPKFVFLSQNPAKTNPLSGFHTTPCLLYQELRHGGGSCLLVGFSIVLGHFVKREVVQKGLFLSL